MSRKSDTTPQKAAPLEIMNSVRSQSPIRLTWTHYRIILQEPTEEGRAWYENKAAREGWGTRTLQRNVSSRYYHRLLKSQNKALVHDEMQKLTRPLQDKLEYLKNPVVAEFMGFKNNATYTESELEQSIIDHLIPFLMELGKGFAFVNRQKHIHTEKEDYYIDLVFYNYHLRCFVLVDLKTTRLRHQDVGQMDMYVKIYDELVRPEGHNPTIGILLCADTDEDVAHYSILNNNDQLFAAKYLTYMPSQEELRREIEQQKEFFRLKMRSRMELKKYKLGELLDVKRGASLAGEYYATFGDYIRLTCGNFDYQNNSFKLNTSKDNLYYTGHVREEFVMKKGDIITPLTECLRGDAEREAREGHRHQIVALKRCPSEGG